MGILHGLRVSVWMNVNLIYYTHTEARMTHFQPPPPHTKYIMYKLQPSQQPIKIKVRFNFKNLWQKYITECTTTNINTIIVKTLLLRNIYQNNYLSEKCKHIKHSISKLLLIC